uniref:EF-hand_13 domain-containing protein n=1 Tax=Strongyloides papillosus TaxID=174720 RepID=A0A0N5C7R7_STREA
MENINDEHYFFSYIHFYVIYCKFWELDEDHDMMITPEDFVRYSDGALPSRVIDRIFKVNKYLKKYPKNSEVPESLDYSDFTLFLLADENKQDASDNDVVSYEVFRTYWLELTSECFDDASIFIRLLVDGASSDSDSAPRRKYLVAEDFRPLISHVIHTIRDLDVLKNAPIFHSIYIDTVITRIFWRVSRTWLNKITAGELRKSNFLDVYGSLDKMENINDEHYFFSYIHFYVIYCKFWELDEDHDMMITPEDFVRYSDGALPSRVIDRIFKVNKYLKKYPKNSEVPESLDYSDFTLFLLADENKRQNKSLEYWFRIL